MKTVSERSARIIEVRHVLLQHRQAFATMPLAQQVVEDYLEKTQRLEKQINKLVQPFSHTYVDRIQMRNDYMNHLQQLIGLGQLMASRNADLQQQTIFKSFHHRLMETSAHRALAIGSKTHQLLSPMRAQLEQLGSGQADLDQLAQLMQAYQQSISTAEKQAAIRRALNSEIRALIVSCNALLREELDKLIHHHRELQPLLYQSYQQIRKPKRRRSNAIKAKTQQNEPIRQEPMQQAKQTIIPATVAATSQPQERQSTKPCPIAPTTTANQKQSTEQSADSLVQEQFAEREKQADPYPLQTSNKLQQSQHPPEWEALLRKLWLS
jgi:hypothetical protein